MPSSEMVNVLEHCQVTPPPSTVVAKSLPLTFYDLQWLHFPPVQHLLFYQFPNSKAHFMQTTIPSLKHSLSLTLKHFYPVAGSGNLIVPPISRGKPEIRYVDGDSVSISFAESSNDFNNLTGNHARNASEFHYLVPQFPPMSMSSDTLVAPLLAVKVTLFPNFGISVGFTLRHELGDGNAFIGFIRSWASLTKLGGDEALLASRSLPFYDRTVIKDPNGLESIWWSQVRERKPEMSAPQNLPTNKVRATFVISRAVVQKLKKWVSAQCPTLSHVSSFSVTCAYVWSCMIKAKAKNEQVGEDELEHLCFGTDCRARLDPPIPPNYFGNCIAPCAGKATSRQLIGEDGFVIAAEIIGKAIEERLCSEEEIFKCLENWISDVETIELQRLLTIAGSPKFRVYEIDFGWGKPKKSEVISIDTTEAMSLHEGRGAQGDLEIGLCLPNIKMEAFAAIFANGLKAL